jgi:hypothetical protein
MGNAKSFEENLVEKTANLNTQHSDLDLMIKRIDSEADRLIALILERKYNDREEICKKLGYQKVDELSQFFEIQTLEGVRYRLGIVPPNNPQLEESKQKVCLDIVNFYLKKINLINNIQKELPNCRNMEKQIYDNLEVKLKSNRLNNVEWLNIYSKLEKFNKEIKTRTALIERELERIRLAKTMQELDLIARTTNSILSNTNSICKNYENDLFQYSNRAEEYKRKEQDILRNVEKDVQVGSPARNDLFNLSHEIDEENSFAPSPTAEQIRERNERNLEMERNRRIELERNERNRRMDEIERSRKMDEIEKNRSLEVERNRRMDEIERNRSLEVERNRSLEVERNRSLEVERNRSLEVERNRSLELEKSRSLELERNRRMDEMERNRRMDEIERSRRMDEIEKSRSLDFEKQRLPAVSPQVVHTVVEEYPVVRRTVRKPVVVRDEVVESVIEPISPAPIKIAKQKLPEIPVETFPEPRLQIGAVRTVATPVINSTKHISVRGESIERNGDTLRVRNPTKIEVTRTVARPKTVAKVVKVEPIYTTTQRIIPPVMPVKEMGIPARAVREHIPRSPNEVPLREGQPVLYLGSGQNGWSRVRHTDGTEGYVPHTYLSK